MKLDVHSIFPWAKPEPEPTRQSGDWASILSRIDDKAYPDSVLALNVQVVCALALLAQREADYADLKRKAVALASSIRDSHYRNVANHQIEALRRRAPELEREPEFITPLVSRGTQGPASRLQS